MINDSGSLMGPDLMRIPTVRTRGFTSTDDYTGNIERLVIPCIFVGYTLTIIRGKLSRQQTIEPVTFSLCILIYCPEVIPKVISSLTYCTEIHLVLL